MSGEFCPATMCPLFAKDGSPWTGEQDALCEHEACGWFEDGRCQGATASFEQVAETEFYSNSPRPLLQIGPLVGGTAARRFDQQAPRTFDCPRAHECKWQLEQDDGQLCPPRHALALGIDPRTCAY